MRGDETDDGEAVAGTRSCCYRPCRRAFRRPWDGGSLLDPLQTRLHKCLGRGFRRNGIDRLFCPTRETVQIDRIMPW